MMNLNEALEFIQSVCWLGTKPGLGRIADLLGRLGDPQKELKFVHITGTNGKGSVAAMMTATRNAAGYKVGRFTSPHLRFYNERINVAGQDICDEDLCCLAEEMKPAVEGMVEKPTEFELWTAMAMSYFKQRGCDIVVLEVGLGGRLDSTNVLPATEVAVITNIGTMHIEHLGSVEGILQAKLEIIEGMREDSRIVFNGDDPMLWKKRIQYQKWVTYFGVDNEECAVRGSCVESGNGVLQFQVSYGTLTYPIELSLEGKHFVSDALAAITVGIELGVSAARIQENLSQFQNAAGRQEIFEANRCTIIQDCYNAGPESMEAALNVLGNRPGRHVAVLGDMLELGVCPQAEHYRVGRIAAEKADLLLAYGPNSGRVISGALTGGMSDTMARSFTEPDAIANAMKRMVKPGDVVLVKGSRGMHMERILAKFLAKETNAEE